MTTFVKSAMTTVPAAKSQTEIIALLGRYGASGFGFRRRGDVVEVTFHFPRRVGGDDQSVRIPVSIETVHGALISFHESPAGKVRRKGAPDTAQAERTAWRVLLTWIEASLLAVKLGAQSMEEAFFAHLVVTTEEGQEGRLIDYVASIGGTYGRLPRPQHLLSSGAK